MKFNIKLNGVTVSKDIPNAWHLVTYQQFLKLYLAKDDFSKIVSVFTDIEPDTIKKAEINNFDVLMSCLSFMDRPMVMATPDKILSYKLYKDIGSEAVARYEDLKEIVKKFIEDDELKNMGHYPLIVATYLCPSPYDFKQAEQIAEELHNAPSVEVLAAGNFILTRFRKSKSPILHSFHRADTRLSRLRRATINWLTRLDFSIRYGIWKNQLPSPVKRFLNGR